MCECVLRGKNTHKFTLIQGGIKHYWMGMCRFMNMHNGKERFKWVGREGGSWWKREG